MYDYRLQNQYAIMLKSTAFTTSLKAHLLNRCVLVTLLCVLWIVAIDILSADIVIHRWVFHPPLPFCVVA